MGGWGRGGGRKVVTDQTEVCAIFNNFLVNVAKDIGVGGAAGWGGGQYDPEFSDHPNPKNLQENLPENLPQFSFRPVNSNQDSKII